MSEFLFTPERPSKGHLVHGSLVISPSLQRRSFRLSPIVILIAIFGIGVSMVLQIFSLIFNMQIITDYAASFISLVSSLILVRGLYPTLERFTFSTGFWLIVTVFFYFILKSLDMWSRDAVTPTVVEALWLCSLFLVVHSIVYFITDTRIRRIQLVSVNRLTTICIRPGSNWILFALFVAFKILAITMLVTLGDVNQLELSAATQNQGAAYLYKIPLIGNILLLTLMYDSFRNRRGWGYVVAGLTLFLIDSVLFSSRSSIVMMALWMAVLYHRYYHPISLLKVSLISAPLVVIISLFGLSRDIQIGSIDAYLEAATTLINQPSLILELFMARIDILPTLSAGLDLYHEGILPSLNGGSYFFAFLHFIPRNFWDTKPLLTAALVTAEVYPGGFVDGVNLLSSILLEGILNFSYFGIVLSGTLVAFLCCQVDHAARSDNLVPGVWALSLTTFPMALFNEGFHSNFTGSILYATFLTFLLYKVLRIVGVLKLRSTIK